MRSISLLCVPSILLLLSGSTTAAESKSAEEAVLAALNTYTTACETRDFDLLSSVFSHDQDIVLINTGPVPGPVVGWPAVAELYKGLFSATTAAKMRHTNVSVKMLAAGSAACLTCNQQVEWFSQGKSYGYDGIRMTCVFEKQQGQWRIAHGHWSLPSTKKPTVRKSDRTPE